MFANILLIAYLQRALYDKGSAIRTSGIKGSICRIIIIAGNNNRLLKQTRRNNNNKHQQLLCIHNNANILLKKGFSKTIVMTKQ